MEMWITNNSSTHALLGVNGNWSNLSSNNQFCTGFYSPVMAVFDILMVAVNLPTTLYVIIELLRRIGTTSNPGNACVFSLSEIFFFHLCCIHFFYYIGVVLIIVQNLGGVKGITKECIIAFHSSSLIGSALFFAAMSIDLYMAVVHPVTYVGLKFSTKLKMAHMCCTLIWVYSITLGIVTVIFDISMYHPLTMTSFYFPLPITITCCIVLLTALRTDRHGENSQSSKPDQTKQKAVRFILNSMFILFIYSMPHCCLLIYTAVKQIKWESLPCHVLPLLIIIKVAEFVAPLFFFYSTGKLTAIATHCITVVNSI